MKDRELPKTPSRTSTIREGPTRAGVSPATVSNTLSGLRGVTGARQRAVLEAVAALGYTSNHAASSLRRGHATLGAVKAINALDLAFPEEISLLGFEHSEWMMAIRPYISTVRQSVDDLAAVSWRTLCNRIADQSADLVRVLLDFRYEFRESTRPPAMVPELAPAARP